MQVAVGQRPAGSPQLRALAERLRRLLPEGRFEDLPDHPGLRNVVGELHGRRPPLVIGAHYDSEAHPPGFVGANDSAAGTAGVIEIARALSKMKRPAKHRAIRFVLYDGEEEPLGCPDGAFYQCALRGSKADVAGPGAHTKAMVLLDYVANKGLRLPREPTSDEDLWGRLRAAARAVGVGKVFPAGEQRYAILDDHTPYLRDDVPAVDLIDFSYRYRDTVKDTVDKVSARSLDAVGESVIELVRDLDRSGY
jgi:Zn-dependent M28 family amino/carboxypeptidase